MRPALVLCFLLVACQSKETNDRLARVEKKLDEVQQAQQTIIVPATAATTSEAAPSAPSVNLQRSALRQDVAEDCVRQGVCAYVPVGNDPMAGLVYQDPKGIATLFEWDKKMSLFMSLGTVDPIIGEHHRASISDEQMVKLRALLAKQ